MVTFFSWKWMILVKESVFFVFVHFKAPFLCNSAPSFLKWLLNSWRRTVLWSQNFFLQHVVTGCTINSSILIAKKCICSAWAFAYILRGDWLYSIQTYWCIICNKRISYSGTTLKSAQALCRTGAAFNWSGGKWVRRCRVWIALTVLFRERNLLGRTSYVCHHKYDLLRSH